MDKMMNVYSTGLELILNACEGVLQIIVTDNEKPLCFEQWHMPQKGTEILTPALEEICIRLHIKPNMFRRVACVAGPGSFTGIRLTLTTASAIRRSTHAQLASLDYLQALATSAVIRRGLPYPRKVYVITHARRNLVHFRQFISFGNQIPAQPLSETLLLHPSEAVKEIADVGCLVCGSGLNRNPEYFSTPMTGRGPADAPDAILMPDLIVPDLAPLCLLARHGDYFPNDIEPQYVRPCDAVENLKNTNENSSQTLQAFLRTTPHSEI